MSPIQCLAIAIAIGSILLKTLDSDSKPDID